MRTRIKICCISSVEEAQQAVAAGADALGLVGQMPSGPGIIDDDLIKEIATSIPPAIATFLLTQRTTADAIADHIYYCGTNTVQIVNHIDPEEYPKLIKQLPAMIRRVQVVHIENNSALDLVGIYAPFVHAFLLDSGTLSTHTPQLGGTGRVHDWSISAEFVRRSPKPVFLAGGINAENVHRALATVRPYGLDLCSSVRSNEKLSQNKLERFMTSVKTFDGY